MNKYKIIIEADVDSCLTARQLDEKLVLALHDIDTGFSKFDGVDKDLEVIDYININIKKI